MERRRQTRGNCLCSAALSGAAGELGPLGISVGMPNITLIPRQQHSPKDLFAVFFVCLFFCLCRSRPELLEVSAVLNAIRRRRDREVVSVSGRFVLDDAKRFVYNRLCCVSVIQ